MIQKIEFVSSDLLAVLEPPEGAPRAYYTSHSAEFELDPTVSFEQIYLIPDIDGPEAARLRAHALLRKAKHNAIHPDAGDPFPLEAAYTQLDGGRAVIFPRTARSRCKRL
ncbi:MAG: hypothetical protein ABI645_00035 [Pseudomonadota bacterium]